MVDAFVKQEMIAEAAKMFGGKMTEATMQKTILTKVGELTGELMGTMASAFKVDESKIAAAFKFNLDEEELQNIADLTNAKVFDGKTYRELTTEELAQMEAEAEAKGEPAAGKSFDSTDFFEAALRRSYGDAGAVPDVPKTAPSKKKRRKQNGFIKQLI